MIKDIITDLLTNLLSAAILDIKIVTETSNLSSLIEMFAVCLLKLSDR
jgi:hypothetical protein